MLLQPSIHLAKFHINGVRVRKRASLRIAQLCSTAQREPSKPITQILSEIAEIGWHSVPGPGKRLLLSEFNFGLFSFNRANTDSPVIIRKL